jgi:hypothetical protein
MQEEGFTPACFNWRETNSLLLTFLVLFAALHLRVPTDEELHLVHQFFVNDNDVSPSSRCSCRPLRFY